MNRDIKKKKLVPTDNDIERGKEAMLKQNEEIFNPKRDYSPIEEFLRREIWKGDKYSSNLLTLRAICNEYNIPDDFFHLICILFEGSQISFPSFNKQKQARAKRMMADMVSKGWTLKEIVSSVEEDGPNGTILNQIYGFPKTMNIKQAEKMLQDDKEGKTKWNRRIKAKKLSEGDKIRIEKFTEMLMLITLFKSRRYI